MSKDYRTLCHKCLQDMRDARYTLKRIGYIKEECDKCNRQGYSYILTKKGIIDSHAR